MSSKDSCPSKAQNPPLWSNSWEYPKNETMVVRRSPLSTFLLLVANLQTLLPLPPYNSGHQWQSLELQNIFYYLVGREGRPYHRLAHILLLARHLCFYSIEENCIHIFFFGLGLYLEWMSPRLTVSDIFHILIYKTARSNAWLNNCTVWVAKRLTASQQWKFSQKIDQRADQPTRQFRMWWLIVMVTRGWQTKQPATDDLRCDMLISGWEDDHWLASGR